MQSYRDYYRYWLTQQFDLVDDIKTSLHWQHLQDFWMNKFNEEDLPIITPILPKDAQSWLIEYNRVKKARIRAEEYVQESRSERIRFSIPFDKYKLSKLPFKIKEELAMYHSYSKNAYFFVFYPVPKGYYFFLDDRHLDTKTTKRTIELLTYVLYYT